MSRRCKRALAHGIAENLAESCRAANSCTFDCPHHPALLTFAPGASLLQVGRNLTTKLAISISKRNETQPGFLYTVQVHDKIFEL
ncbi:hypothetical protein CI102_10965 [Trichoderma harzianum]|nr:hypothetical protein CI102_10965 [Trichoderma harzianum]